MKRPEYQPRHAATRESQMQRFRIDLDRATKVLQARPVDDVASLRLNIALVIAELDLEERLGLAIGNQDAA